MTRCVRNLQILAVLLATGSFWAVTPDDLLPRESSAESFQVDVGRMPQVGGCWINEGTTCPQVPYNAIPCDCLGPDDDCSETAPYTKTSPGLIVIDATIPAYPQSGFQYIGDETSQLCAWNYYCVAPCEWDDRDERYTCAFQQSLPTWGQGSPVNPDYPVWCDLQASHQPTPEYLAQRAVAATNGIGTRLFSLGMAQ